jgi:hypothetical protein
VLLAGGLPAGVSCCWPAAFLLLSGALLPAFPYSRQSQSCKSLSCSCPVGSCWPFAMLLGGLPAGVSCCCSVAFLLLPGQDYRLFSPSRRLQGILENKNKRIRTLICPSGHLSEQKKAKVFADLPLHNKNVLEGS